MNARHNKRKGFSLIELLIVVTIILIIAAIAIPNLMRSKIQANETGGGGSAQSLDGKRPPVFEHLWRISPRYFRSGAGVWRDSAHFSLCRFDDSVLASGVKSGYKFAYTAGTTDPAGNVLTYTITCCAREPGFDRPTIFLYRSKRHDSEYHKRQRGDSTSPPIS